MLIILTTNRPANELSIQKSPSAEEGRQYHIQNIYQFSWQHAPTAKVEQFSKARLMLLSGISKKCD